MGLALKLNYTNDMRSINTRLKGFYLVKNYNINKPMRVYMRHIRERYAYLRK